MTTKPTHPQTDPNQLTFKVSVSNITPTTAEITVSPSNETKSYFSDIVTDADWLESQKHGFDDYLQYFIEVVMMEQQEMTREGGGQSHYFLRQRCIYGQRTRTGSQVLGRRSRYRCRRTRRRSLPQKLYSADCESTNTFEIATTAITQTGASITVTPSNSDVYFLDVLSADISPRCRRVRIIKNI